MKIFQLFITILLLATVNSQANVFKKVIGPIEKSINSKLTAFFKSGKVFVENTNLYNDDINEVLSFTRK